MLARGRSGRARNPRSACCGAHESPGQRRRSSSRAARGGRQRRVDVAHLLEEQVEQLRRTSGRARRRPRAWHEPGRAGRAKRGRGGQRRGRARWESGAETGETPRDGRGGRRSCARPATVGREPVTNARAGRTARHRPRAGRPRRLAQTRRVRFAVKELEPGPSSPEVGVGQKDTSTWSESRVRKTRYSADPAQTSWWATTSWSSYSQAVQASATGTGS